MLQRLLMISLLWLLPLAACHADDTMKKELAGLEGTWMLVKMEINGKSLLKKDEKTKVVIKDGKLMDGPKAATDLSKILGPSKMPKTATLPYEKVVFYGIYELKGDELRVC